MTTVKRYGEQIAQQMQRVRAAITRGETKIRFSCKVGRHLLHRDIDVSSAENQSTVDRMLYAHCQTLIKESVGLDALELLRVAQCPKCREWFPSFEERNEHRAETRRIGLSCDKMKKARQILDDPFLVAMRATDLTQGQREITESGS